MTTHWTPAPHHTSTTAAAAAAASTLRTRRRVFWRTCHRATGRGEDLKDLAFGARAARALLATRHHHRCRLCAAHAEIDAQLGSSVAFGSGCGQALPGCRTKRLYVNYPFDTTRPTVDNRQKNHDLQKASMCARPRASLTGRRGCRHPLPRRRWGSQPPRPASGSPCRRRSPPQQPPEPRGRAPRPP